MQISAADTLTDMQRQVLRDVFRGYADVIDRVDLYGSRARGDHRPGSDVDLLIHGAIDRQRFARLWTDLDESPLSILFDLHLASEAMSPRFKAAIKRDAIPLFTRTDLIAVT